MNEVKLGKTGPAVSSVALGTWTFAGDAIWGSSDEEECVRVVHAALDHGITLFDSAPNYGDGRSERILGRALGNNSSVYVATKLKITGLNENDIRDNVYGSLERLGREAIDILQIHWPGANLEETLGALDAFQELRTEGVVRHIAACNFGVFDLSDAEGYPLVSNQIPYSLLWRVAEKGVAKETKRRGIATMAYTVLQQGLLTGQYRSLEEFPEGRKRTRHFGPAWPGVRHTEDGMEGETIAALSKLLALSDAWNRPLFELALAYAHSRPFLDVLLVGARTVKQLTRSLAAAESKLSQPEETELEAATEELLQATGNNPDMYQSESRIRFPAADGEPTRF